MARIATLLMLSVALLFPEGAHAAVEDPVVVTDKEFCASLIPGKKEARLRARCEENLGEYFFDALDWGDEDDTALFGQQEEGKLLIPESIVWVLLTLGDQTITLKEGGGWTVNTANKVTSGEPIASFEPATFAGDGVFVVGVDLVPGTYRTAGGTDGPCYWERQGGFSGESEDTIANGFVEGPIVVTVGATDAGLKTQGCQPWTRVR